jgi:hypothetical protein
MSPSGGHLRAVWLKRSGWLLVALVLAGGSVWSLRTLSCRGSSTQPHEKLYYPSGKFLREATAGFHQMAADYLWFQMVQYYGGFRKGEHDLYYFRGLIDNIVTLDPRFLEAYRFCALVMAMDLGDGAGAINILKRGILTNPDCWILPFEIGFIYYVFACDYPRAAVWFDAAARAPDATDFVRRFAAFCHKRAGDLEVSIALWTNLYETSNDPYMKELAKAMIVKCQEELGRRGADPAGDIR